MTADFLEIFVFGLVIFAFGVVVGMAWASEAEARRRQSIPRKPAYEAAAAVPAISYVFKGEDKENWMSLTTDRWRAVVGKETPPSPMGEGPIRIELIDRRTSRTQAVGYESCLIDARILAENFLKDRFRGDTL